VLCSNCERAKICPAHAWFNPACRYCGARLIQHLGLLLISPAEIATRRRANLADWVAAGHSEAEIRALAKGLHPCTGPATPSVCADRPILRRR
jgi:hypothetical protein